MKTTEVLEHILKGKRVKPNTQYIYKTVLTAYSNYSPEWCTTGSEINEFLNSLTNLADTSVNMYFKVIKSTCAYMNKTFNLPDPSGKAEIPKVERKRRRYFTSEELLKIINSSKTEFDKTLVLTLIDSTCRIGELASLTVNNIGDSWLDLQGKTGQRRYRCDPFICEKLKKLAGDKKFVFIDKSHKQMKVNALARHVRMVIKAAGITGSKLGPHTLRHSGASLVAQNTGSVLMVKALLQHDNINTSMVYIHDAEDKLRQRISPLQLMSDETKASNMTQLALAPGETEPEQQPCDGTNIIDLLELEFKEVPPNTTIHSRFDNEDLELIRRAFIGYIKTRAVPNDEILLKNIFSRMLRKVK